MIRKRISELDSLRGIAAISVMFYHYSVRFSDKFGIQLDAKYMPFEFGKYGVELFFTISGFVIYMSVNNLVNPKEFVYKRFVRLYPTFWICLIITFMTTTFFGPQLLIVKLSDFLLNFSMIPSLFEAKAVDGVYWTLKIELFFYCVIFSLLLLNWLDEIRLLGFAYLFCGLCLYIVARANSGNLISSITNYYYYGLLFLCGINFYKIFKNGQRFWNIAQIGISCILTSLLIAELQFIFFSVMIIFILLIKNKLMFLSIKPLIFLGQISYALYLIHQNIGYTIQLNIIGAGINNYAILILTPVLISILISWLITSLLERKFISQIFKQHALRLK